MTTKQTTGCAIAAATATIAVAVIAAVEVTGALGGLLAGHGPVLLSPLQALQTAAAAAAAGDLEHVRRAWPLQTRAELVPSPRLRAVGVFGVLTAASVIVAAVLVAQRLVRHAALRRDAQGAEFAGKGDLDELVVKRAGAGRVVLGTFHGKLIAAAANASTLIVAPSQSGKTSGLMTPAILEWEGPLLATSVKGDLLIDTFEARRRVGEVRVFDPMGALAGTKYAAAAAAWSPILASRDWTSARRVAATLLQVDVAGGGSSSDESFWRPSSQGYLAALLLAAHLSRASIADVLAWIKAPDLGDVDDATTALENDDTRGAGAALEEIEGLWGMDPKFISSVRATLSTALYAWGEESVEDATAATENGITAEWLLSGNNTLYLVAPAQDQHRLKGLFSAVIQTVISEAFKRSARTGKAIDPRLLLGLDEAANIAPISNLDAIASTGPGQGVTVLTVLQNMSQADEAWGSDKASTIIANHRARLFGSGIADTATLSYLGTVLGDRAARQTSTTKDRGEIFTLGSRTESTDRRALLGADKIRQSEPDTALLVYGRLKPATIALRPFYKDRRLSRLSAAKTPLPSSPAAAADSEPAAAAAKPLPAPPAPEPELEEVHEINVDELNPSDLGASTAATAPYDLSDEPEPDEDDGEQEPPDDVLAEFEALDGLEAEDAAADLQTAPSGHDRASEPAGH